MTDNNDFTHEFQIYSTDLNAGTMGTGKFLLFDNNINAVKVESIDNIKIGGGDNGKVLATDGEGNLRWLSVAAVTGGVSSYNDLDNLPDLSVYAQTADLATVATSGSYNDLTNKPSLFSGSYTDLTGKPTLVTSYNQLTDKPSIPTVPTNVSSFTNDAGYLTSVTNITGNAGTVSNGVYTTGSYADPTWITSLAYSKLTGTPNLFSGAYADLTGKPTLFSGSYTDLTNKPSIFSGSYTDLTNKPVLFDGAYLSLTGLPNLAAVATSGSYDDLSNKPSIPAAQVNADWNEIASESPAYIFNKPSIPSLDGYATEAWVQSQGYGSGGGGVTLPANASGFLQNDGAGNLSWAATPARLVSANGTYEVILDNTGAVQLSSYGVVKNPDHVNIVSDGWAQLQWVDTNTLDNADPNATQGPTNWIYVDQSGIHVETNINSNINDSTQRYDWNFDIYGKLTMPLDGDIVDSNGTSVLNRIPTYISSGNTAPGSAVVANDTNVSVNFSDGGSGKFVFNADGSLKLGNGVKLSAEESNKFMFDSTTVSAMDLRDELGHGFYTDNSGFGILSGAGNPFYFDNTGVLKLPSGGDIVDNLGNSVLGGSGVSLPANASGYLTNDGAGNLAWAAGDGTFSGDYNDLVNKPTIPTATSDLTNDSGFITSDVSSSIIPTTDNTIDLGSPTNRFRHLYVAPGTIYLGDIKLTNLNGKLDAKKVINPGEENEEVDQEDGDAFSELRGGGSGNFSGSYNDLTNKPTIPADVSDLTDNSGLLGGGGGGSNSLDPYVTIVGGEVNVTANISFAASDVPGAVFTLENNSETVRFYQAAGDTDGNTYVLGHSYQNNGYNFVYAFAPSGAVLWKQAIAFNDQQYTGYGNGIKINGDYIYVGGKYYNGTTDSHYVVTLNKADGTLYADRVFRTPQDTYPNIYDIEVDGSGNMMYAGSYGNETALLENVPVAGSGDKWVYFNNSDLQGYTSMSGNGGQWRIETSPGVFSYLDQINSAIVPVTSVTGGGSGMIAGFRYDQNQSNYWGGYLTDGGSGYNQGDQLKVPGSLLRGIDGGTTVTAVPGAWNDNGGSGNLSLYFDKATYPNLFNQIQSCSWTVTYNSGASGPYNINGAYDAGGNWQIDIASTDPVVGDISFYTANGNDATWTYNGGQLNGLAGLPSPTLKATTWLFSYSAPDYTGTTTLNLKTSLSAQAVVWTPSWFKSFGGNEQYENFDDISYDSFDDSIYLCGNFWKNDNNTYHQGAVFKLNNTDGSVIWSNYIEDGTGQCNIKSVLPDGTGNIYAVGENNNGYTLITKLDSSSNVVWQSRQTDNNNWNNEPRGSLDSEGNVYITGSWYNGNRYVTLIIKINGSDGTLAYSREFYNDESQDMYEFDNEDNQHTAIVGSNMFWAGYTRDANGNNDIGVAFRLPIDGSITGQYGRWHIDNDGNTNWEDCTNDAQLITANYSPMTPSTTTIDTDVASVSTDTGSSTANRVSMGGTTAGLTGVNSITFGDGSVQTTAAGAAVTWQNPNGNTWRIEEYNGGAAVTYNGNSYDAKWFDVANSPSGNNNFRGAIIQYHAFINNRGVVIGTIHLANDYSQDNATHTEHLSGNSDLQYATFWDCNYERGQLFFKMTDGNSYDAMIQWKATIFYGAENNC